MEKISHKFKTIATGINKVIFKIQRIFPITQKNRSCYKLYFYTILILKGNLGFGTNLVC